MSKLSKYLCTNETSCKCMNCVPQLTSEQITEGKELLTKLVTRTIAITKEEEIETFSEEWNSWFVNNIKE